MKGIPSAARRGCAIGFGDCAIRFGSRLNGIACRSISNGSGRGQDACRRPASQLDSRWKLLFDRQVLAWFWPFAREEPHGHPPFYALLGLAGDVLDPVMARIAARPSGADPPLQPHGRRDLRLCLFATGATGRPRLRPVPGCCSRICSDTVITLHTTPS